MTAHVISRWLTPTFPTLVLVASPAFAWESTCEIAASQNVGKGDVERRIEACPRGASQALVRWTSPQSGGDEHSQLLERAMRSAGIPESLIGDYGHVIFTKASNGRVPAPFDQVDSTYPHVRSIPEFSLLPDLGYTFGDYATGFQTCPPFGQALPADRCHDYINVMAMLNANHFSPQNGFWYRAYHELALDRATECARMRTLLGARSTDFTEFVDECTYEALALEAVGQHYLQDIWAMGHMWPRWGSARVIDFNLSQSNSLNAVNIERSLQRAKIVGFAAGMLHGLYPWDAMSAPAPEVAFISATRMSEPTRGVGDGRLRDLLTDPLYDRQRNELETCSQAGLRQVYAQATAATPTPDPSATCLAPLATNAALLHGFGIDRIGVPFVFDGLGIVSSFLSDEPDLQRRPVANALKDLGLKLWIESHGKEQGTDLASGGIGSFLGIKSNAQLTDATLAAVYPEEVGPWPARFASVGENDDGRDRAAAIPRLYHRGHAIDWCESITREDLYALRERAKGLDPEEPTAQVCTELVRRHLRMVIDPAPEASSNSASDPAATRDLEGCEPAPGEAAPPDTTASREADKEEVLRTAPLCSLLTASSAEIVFHVPAGSPKPEVDVAASDWCTRPDCPGCGDNLFTYRVNGYPVLQDGSAGGDGTLTRISLGEGYGIPSEILFGPDGRLWLNGNGLTSMRATAAVTVEGEEAQPNISFDVTRYPRGLPTCMAFGPDGNLWFTAYRTDALMRLNPQCGDVTTFPVPTAGSQPFGIATGPDGNIWFTERDASQIGRMTPEGAVGEFALPQCEFCGVASSPTSIAAGVDGNMWFLVGTSASAIDLSGNISSSTSGTLYAANYCRGVLSGPDGSIWVGQTGLGLSRLNLIDGTESGFPIGDSLVFAGARNMALASDGSLWFTDFQSGRQIGRISPTGALAFYGIPVEAGAIAIGPDSNVWFTSPSAVWRLRP